MVLRFANLTATCVGVLLVCGIFSPGLQADTRTTNDYIAVVFEAEDHSSKDERWVLTEPSTPAQENDPDQNHSDQAVGNAYLELLPDIRVTEHDPFGPPDAFWNNPGDGPKATYQLSFPEAGRYYVHVRAYSTGNEDNSIHVGLNDNWLNSGARLQFCSGKNSWYWSSNQRDSGGAGSCGVEKTIWVTVEEAGNHDFMISPREDGFEIDRIMLIKDKSNNTRICSPDGADGISCRNGSLENVDDVVDLGVELESEDNAIQIDEVYDFSAVVLNHDGYDTGSNVSLTLDIEGWDAESVDEACTLQSGDIVCDLGNLAPSGPEEEHRFNFVLTPMRSGELPVSATLSTDSVDGYAANDSSILTATVSDPGLLSQLSVALTSVESEWVSGVESTVGVVVSSVGTGDAEDVVMTFTLPAGVSATTLPAQCTDTGTVSCDLGELAVDSSIQLDLGVTADEAGLFSSNAMVTASNIDGDDVTDTIIVTVAEPETDEPGSEELPTTEPPESTSDSSGAIGLWYLLALVLAFACRSAMPGRSIVSHSLPINR